MKSTVLYMSLLAITCTTWQCQPPEEATASGELLQTQLTAHNWTAQSYIINGKSHSAIELFHDQLRYPGEDLRQMYMHQFRFSMSGEMTVTEQLETHSRFYASNFDIDWALDQDRCGCTAQEEEWYVEGNNLFVRDGSIDLPYFLEPPYSIQAISGDKMILRGALRVAGYSEDLRNHIVKLNGMVTTGEGIDIDIVLVPGQ